MISMPYPLKRKRGWFNKSRQDSIDHGLAAKGIKTRQKTGLISFIPLDERQRLPLPPSEEVDKKFEKYEREGFEEGMKRKEKKTLKILKGTDKKTYAGDRESKQTQLKGERVFKPEIIDKIEETDEDSKKDWWEYGKEKRWL